MGNFRDKLVRFMYGRYGIDQLYYGLAIFCFILLIVNLFIRSTIISVVMWLVLLLMLFRTFSKNIYKRRKENEKFMKVWNKVKSKALLTYRRIKEVRSHRFHKCPHCKAMLRLPRKKGKHTVQCPRCDNEFDVRVIF